MWWLQFIPVVGTAIKAWSDHDQKKMDVSLEKYKVDGKLDQDLVDADVKLKLAQQSVNQSRDLYAGDRYLRYLFGYPTGVYYAAIVADSCLQRVFNWKYDVLALPEPAASWAGWIVAGLFGISAAKKVFAK